LVEFSRSGKHLINQFEKLKSPLLKTTKMNLSTLNIKPVKSTLEIGNILRQKRKSQGLTLEQVAQHSGLSMRFISEVERGKPTAEFGKVLFLLSAVGVDLFVSTRE